MLVDVGMAQQLGALSSELKANGVGPVFCWSSVAHLSAQIRQNVGEVGDAKFDPKFVQDIVDGVGLEGLNGDSDGIIFFTSGYV